MKKTSRKKKLVSRKKARSFCAVSLSFSTSCPGSFWRAPIPPCINRSHPPSSSSLLGALGTTRPPIRRLDSWRHLLADDRWPRGPGNLRTARYGCGTRQAFSTLQNPDHDGNARIVVTKLDDILNRRRELLSATMRKARETVDGKEWAIECL